MGNPNQPLGRISENFQKQVSKILFEKMVESFKFLSFISTKEQLKSYKNQPKPRLRTQLFENLGTQIRMSIFRDLKLDPCNKFYLFVLPFFLNA